MNAAGGLSDVSTAMQGCHEGRIEIQRAWMGGWMDQSIDQGVLMMLRMGVQATNASSAVQCMQTGRDKTRGCCNGNN